MITVTVTAAAVMGLVLPTTVTVSNTISTHVPKCPCQHDKCKSYLPFSLLVRCKNQLDVPECSVYYSWQHITGV